MNRIFIFNLTMFITHNTIYIRDGHDFSFYAMTIFSLMATFSWKNK
jgi:hypothetical protein